MSTTQTAADASDERYENVLKGRDSRTKKAFADKLKRRQVLVDAKAAAAAAAHMATNVSETTVVKRYEESAAHHAIPGLFDWLNEWLHMAVKLTSVIFILYFVWQSHDQCLYRYRGEYATSNGALRDPVTMGELDMCIKGVIIHWYSYGALWNATVQLIGVTGIVMTAYLLWLGLTLAGTASLVSLATKNKGQVYGQMVRAYLLGDKVLYARLYKAVMTGEETEMERLYQEWDDVMTESLDLTDQVFKMEDEIKALKAKIPQATDKVWTAAQVDEFNAQIRPAEEAFKVWSQCISCNSRLAHILSGSKTQSTKREL